MRWWHQTVATLGDLFPGGVPTLGFVLLTVAAVVAVLWYFWPAWLPGGRRVGAGRRWRWRWPRWRWPFRRGFWRRFRLRWSRVRWRWRWRRRRPTPSSVPAPAVVAPDELPDLPAHQLALTADELAAQGRYQEAVRERLRAIVRELVERELLDYRPGWTVTELTARAVAAHPPLTDPLTAAGDVFSGVWYGGRPAGAAEDAAMRRHHAAVLALLAGGLAEQRQVSG